MRHIDNATIASLLRPEDLIPAMRAALIDYSAGKFTQPPRRILEVHGHDGFFGNMTAIGTSAMGAKLVSIYPGNDARGLATHMSLIVLFDAATGAPLATMDADVITEMRTAAVSAVFVDAVAPKDVSSLAIFGAGAQAKSHLDALACVRTFTDIRICNRTRVRAEQLASEYAARAMDAENATQDADVIIAATTSREPVFDGDWLKPGAIVVSVGWAGADVGELDATTMSNKVIVDSREGVQIESGNVRRWDADVFAELGELLAGSKTVDSGATIVFDSIGMACEDIAAAELVWQQLAPT